jgi:hypothetical protein
VTLTGGTAIYGNVFAGGSVSQPLGTTISGEIFANSPNFVLEPIAPDLSALDGIALPAPAEFTSGGDSHFLIQNVSLSLPPGSYGTLGAKGWIGNSVLTLHAGSTGDGIYYFDKVTLGQSLTLRLDLSGSHDIRVFVSGDIQGNGDLKTYVSTDGSNYFPITSASVDPELASRVYWESKGNFYLAYSSKWFGSVYTPSGNISTAWGPIMVGSFFSRYGHYLPGGDIVYVAANYFKEQ